MNTFNVSFNEVVSQNIQAILNNINKALGFIPNIYVTCAHSDLASENYLNFTNKKRQLTTKIKKAVTLDITHVIVAFRVVLRNYLNQDIQG